MAQTGLLTSDPQQAYQPDINDWGFLSRYGAHLSPGKSHLTGTTEISRTLQAITRDRNRLLKISVALKFRSQTNLPMPCVIP
jgi:hypothetical protein